MWDISKKPQSWAVAVLDNPPSNNLRAFFARQKRRYLFGEVFVTLLNFRRNVAFDTLQSLARSGIVIFSE
jgi:hypothetical protein